MTLVMRSAARSDVGLIRRGNEDSGFAGPDLLVVADGMGGHAAGELASASAIAVFAGLDRAWTDDDGDAVLSALADGVARSSDAIRAAIEAEPDLQGMGTTLTALAWDGGRMGLVHVGDSRGYLLREGELAQITHDHTYVQMLVDTGRITSDEAAVHSRRNLLMRAIDGVTPTQPDLQIREARAGDRYLLCSDGLSGVVPHDELTTLLAGGDPTYAVTALVERAVELGAPDNVTAVVADVVDVDSDDAAAEVATSPVVVGAAGERRVREQLPGLQFPADAELDPDAIPVTSPAPVEPVELPGTSEAGTERADAPAPGTRRRRRPRARSIVALGVALVALASITTGVLLWARSQYYVGDAGGYVAVFRGLPASVGGLRLSSVETTSTVAVSDLPTFQQERVATNIPASGSDDAVAIVSRLGVEASKCVVSPTLGCPAPTTSTTTSTATLPPTITTPTTSPAPGSPTGSTAGVVGP